MIIIKEYIVKCVFERINRTSLTISTKLKEIERFAFICSNNQMLKRKIRIVHSQANIRHSSLRFTQTQSAADAAPFVLLVLLHNALAQHNKFACA